MQPAQGELNEAMDMRKKSQSWLVPLLILIAALWAMGKKDTPPIQVRSNPPPPPNSLVSAPLPATQPIKNSPIHRFVNANRLNLRDEPAGKVISTLKRGDKIQVFEWRDDWARVSADGQPARWLSSKSLCEAVDCYVVSKPEATRPVSLTPQPIPRQPTIYGSSCPCSSGTVCIGPRGGRYCITSGGNKRYGV